jgi:HNH endonuclease
MSNSNSSLNSASASRSKTRCRRKLSALSAKEVDVQLKTAVADLNRAETNVILLFYEMNRRRLFRSIGCATIQQYAQQKLGFSKNKTYRFMRLVAELDRLPRLHRAVSTGKLGWTKALEVSKVASAETEKEWIDEAQSCSKHELEAKVNQVRVRAKAARTANPQQPRLPVHPVPPGPPAPDLAARSPAESTATEGTESDLNLLDGLSTLPKVDGPISVTIQFSSLEYAQYEAMLEKIRKLRLVPSTTSKAMLLLHGLHALLEIAATPAVDAADLSEDIMRGGNCGINEIDGHNKSRSNRKPIAQRASLHTGNTCNHFKNKSTTPTTTLPRKLPRGHDATKIHVMLYCCESCGKGTIKTGKGEKRLSQAQIETAMCDSVVSKQGGRNRRTIAPSVRRDVLMRDHHTCKAPGCENSRFLEVHHLNPRKNGGSNRLENLITLCSTCHQFFHEQGLGRWPSAR